METKEAMRNPRVQVRELVPNFNEKNGASWLEASVDVVAYQQADNSMEYRAGIQHPPLDSRGLHQFLRRISPQGGQTVGGIMADWRMPDQRQEGQLKQLHERLGPAWDNFMLSRKVFMDVLGDPEKPYFGYGYQRNGYFQEPVFLAKSQITHNGVLAEAICQMPISEVSASSLLSQFGVKDAEQVVFESMKRAVNRGKTGKKKVKTPQKISATFAAFSTTKKRAALHDLVRGLDPEQKKAFIEFGQQEFFESFIGDDGSEYFISKRRLTDDIGSVIQNGEELEGGSFSAKAVSIKTQRGKLSQNETYILPGSVKRTIPKIVISPVISWRKTPNEDREFVFSAPEEQPGNHCLDNVLGVLAVSYLTPEVRAKWPTKLRIGNSRQQDMGEAQVPVLALFPATQKALLVSDFIRNAEKLAE